MMPRRDEDDRHVLATPSRLSAVHDNPTPDGRPEGQAPYPPLSPAAKEFALGAMTVQAAAEFTGLGESTIHELRRKGRLVTTKCGRRLISKRSLLELLGQGIDTGKP